MGDLCWNSTSGVPTQVTRDAKPWRHSITEAFQIITPVAPCYLKFARATRFWLLVA